MKVDEDYLAHKLGIRFPFGKGYVLLRNVRNATGYQKQERYADVIVMGMWPSRGLEIDGFEIKVSRNDMLTELRDPTKADAIARYCDRWWVVVADSSIVKAEELPKRWGLLVYHEKSDTLRQTKRALTNSDVLPITRDFVASLIRSLARAQPSASEAAIAAATASGRRDGIKIGRKQVENERYRDRRLAENEARRLQERVERFEQEAGIKLDEWSYPKHIGRVAQVLVSCDVAVAVDRIDAAQETVGIGIRRLREALRDVGVEVRKRDIPELPSP